MKFRISLFLLTLALAASSQVHASACTNSSIAGTYAFTLRGQIFLPDGSTLASDGVAKQTFDGKGNLTQVDAVATNGVLAPGWRPGTGSYSVNADCTGTETIVIPGLSDLHLRLSSRSRATKSAKWSPIQESQPLPRASASGLPKTSDCAFQRGPRQIERGIFSPLFVSALSRDERLR